MEVPSDTYRTLVTPCEEIIFKAKKSKFYAIAFPIKSETEVKPLIKDLKKKHHTANHVCYAWQLGAENPRYRANDDGEPNNSAGMPIYGQILAYDVTNVLVAVTRIFGGTKLGVGGLISAYREASQLALASSKIIVKTITDTFELSFTYSDMDIVMRLIKQNNVEIISQHLEIDCKLIIAIRKSDSSAFQNKIEAIHTVSLKKEQ